MFELITNILLKNIYFGRNWMFTWFAVLIGVDCLMLWISEVNLSWWKTNDKQVAIYPSTWQWRAIFLSAPGGREGGVGEGPELQGRPSDTIWPPFGRLTWEQQTAAGRMLFIVVSSTFWWNQSWFPRKNVTKRCWVWQWLWTTGV